MRGHGSSFARAVETRAWTGHGQPRPAQRRSTLRWTGDVPIICCAVGSPRPGSRRSVMSHRLEREFPFRTPGKKDKPLRYANLWRVDRDEKARSVVALSRVPRLKQGSPVRLRLPVGTDGSSASCPIPANRHTTTGTCEIGQGLDRQNRAPAQAFFRSFLVAARASQASESLQQFSKAREACAEVSAPRARGPGSRGEVGAAMPASGAPPEPSRRLQCGRPGAPRLAGGGDVQSARSAMSSRWIISARPLAPVRPSMSRLLRPTSSRALTLS